MGNCNANGQSKAFTLADLQDLKLGQTKEMGHGCGPRITGTQGGSCYAQLVRRGFGFPNNGEFAWGGMGSSCNMCSDVSGGYGCDNCGGANAIGGNRGSVKRIAYLADPAKCCQQQQPIINGGVDMSVAAGMGAAAAAAAGMIAAAETAAGMGQTCDPKYLDQYASDVCDVYMKNYCQQDPNLSSPTCQSWVKASLNGNRTTPNVVLEDYCSTGKNFTTKTCQEWCNQVKNLPNMAGECDQAAATYCQNNSSDPLCTCMNPPKNVSQAEDLIASAKVCWYAPCKDLSNDNYMTSTMRDQKKNCVTTECTIQTGDIEVSGTNNQIQFKNSCATDILKPPTPEEQEQAAQQAKTNADANQAVTNAQTNPATPSSATSSTWINSNMVRYGVMALIVVCVIVAIICFKFQKTWGAIISLMIAVFFIGGLIYLLKNASATTTAPVTSTTPSSS